MKQSKDVALVDLGEVLEINLNTLAKKLNSLQKTFIFKIIDPVTCESVGDPNIDDEWYDSKALFEVLQKCSDFPEYDFVIGLTNFKIAHLDEKGKVDKDYFSISDLRRFSLVSFNKDVYQFNSKSKSKYQYAAYQVITELIINTIRRNIMHYLANGCLFDDCVDRKTFANNINRSYICSKCHSELKRRNVSDRALNDVQKVLRYCRKNDLKTSLINTAKNPATNLLVGAVIGWVAQVFANDASSSPIIAVALVFFLLIIFLYVRYFSNE